MPGSPVVAFWGALQSLPHRDGRRGNPSSAPSPHSSQPGYDSSDYSTIISLDCWDLNPAEIAASWQVQGSQSEGCTFISRGC